MIYNIVYWYNPFIMFNTLIILKLTAGQKCGSEFQHWLQVAGVHGCVCLALVAARKESGQVAALLRAILLKGGVAGPEGMEPAHWHEEEEARGAHAALKEEEGGGRGIQACFSQVGIEVFEISAARAG